MNKLPLDKRIQILSLLCEGSSMRSISRVCDVSINTVGKILADAGRVCMAFHDGNVRKVHAQRVQIDEIWSFTCAKQKRVASAKVAPEGAGDTWTWIALEADSKLIVQWFVGRRDADCAKLFIDDLASRLANRVQLTSDGVKAYLESVEGAIGADVDYTQLVKMYGNVPEGRYSPAECTGIRKICIEGDLEERHISTSHAEPQNLTMRLRLFTCLSKKFESYVHMAALYTVWYNWIRISLRVTPAMAAGLTDKLMTFEDIVELMDTAAPKQAANHARIAAACGDSSRPRQAFR